eukprot:1258863-Heterocapsa_arctica.AAC.1
MAGRGPGLGSMNCGLHFFLKNRLGGQDVITALDKGRAVHDDLTGGVDTRAELRGLLHVEFHVSSSAVVESWEAAVQRATKAREAEALQRSARLPRVLVRPDYVALRAAFGAGFFMLEDRLAPSEALIALRMEQIEDYDY